VPSGTGIWTQRAPIPSAIASSGRAAVLNGSIYIAIDDILYVYDPYSNAWRSQSTIPVPQGANMAGFLLSACVDKLYVIGEGASNERRIYINEAYDPTTDSWENKTPPNIYTYINI